jgi:uncharacterized protein (UPF0303 family)
VAIADDITKIKQQEQELHFASFTEEDAWALGMQMRAAAHVQKLPLVMDIRVGKRQLFYAALPGTVPDNDEWVRRKSNSVQRFHKSSYRIGRELDLEGKTLTSDRCVDEGDYASHGGGFPIFVPGAGIIGAVTVSGIPQRQDHGFVVEQLCIYLKKDHASLALAPENK